MFGDLTQSDMSHGPFPDPGWNVHLRASGFFGKPNPDREPPPRLPVIKQWRFMWGYLLAPGLVVGLTMNLGLIIFYKVHPAQRPLGQLWVLAAIDMVALAAVLVIGRLPPKWPDHNDPALVREAYKNTLQRGVNGATITMFLAVAVATFAALSSLPLISVAAVGVWALVMATITPTRARVQRHVLEAAALGLDLPSVIFQSPPPD